MTREQIEAALKERFAWIDYKTIQEVDVRYILDFAIKQVNAALEEAANVASNAKLSIGWGSGSPAELDAIRRTRNVVESAIRSLKIK